MNFKQNNWAKLLPMAEFTYNNTKNSSTGFISFELNYGYHPRISFDKDTNFRSQSRSADKVSAKLQDLMTICQENFHHAQELQKRAHNKGVKRRSYGPSNKVELNSKYIKTKRNQKLEAKFFELFRVLHLVGKQTYKLELSKWWKMHNLFHLSFLKQDTTRKERVDKRVTELKTGNSEEYEIEAIWDSIIYVSKSESGKLLGLYYLVAWKGYPKEKNTWKPLSAVQHLKKLICCFHKEHPEKLTATFPPIKSTPPMVRSTVRPTPLKWMQSWPAGGASKRAKNWVLDACHI